MHPALRLIFEEQLAFSMENGERLLGRVFVGETEVLPVQFLRYDDEAYRFEFTNWQNEIWMPEQGRRRGQLLGLSGNGGRYSELKQAVSRGRVLPFVGSGMSVPSGLPAWWDLLIAIAGQVSGEIASIEALLQKGAFETAVDAILAATNRKLFNERIEHALRLDDANVIVGAARLLPILFPNLVISTNLDPLLERLYEACDASFEAVLTGAELASFRKLNASGARILVKLHGDHQKPSTRVLTCAEYDGAYGPAGVAKAELSNLYRNNTLLFLGCSLLGDRTLEAIKEAADEDSDAPKHFSFSSLPESRPDQIARENFLTSRGIFPIWYDGDHDECIMSLLAGLLKEAA